MMIWWLMATLPTKLSQSSFEDLLLWRVRLHNLSTFHCLSVAIPSIRPLLRRLFFEQWCSFVSKMRYNIIYVYMYIWLYYICIYVQLVSVEIYIYIYTHINMYLYNIYICTYVRFCLNLFVLHGRPFGSLSLWWGAWGASTKRCSWAHSGLTWPRCWWYLVQLQSTPAKGWNVNLEDMSTLYHSYTLKGVETWIRYEKYWKILVTLCYFSITSLILSSLSWCLQFLFLTPQQQGNMTDLSTSIGALLPSDFCLHAAGESAANCRHFRISCGGLTAKNGLCPCNCIGFGDHHIQQAMKTRSTQPRITKTWGKNKWHKGKLKQYIPIEADEGVVTFQGWLGSVQIVQSWIISETWVVSLIMHFFPVVFCWHYHWIASRKCIMITHQRVHPDAISIDKLWCLHSQ